MTLVGLSPCGRFFAAVTAGGLVSVSWPGGAPLVITALALSLLVSAAVGTLIGLTDVLWLVVAATIVGVTLGAACQVGFGTV